MNGLIVPVKGKQATFKCIVLCFDNLFRLIFAFTEPNFYLPSFVNHLHIVKNILLGIIKLPFIFSQFYEPRVNVPFRAAEEFDVLSQLGIYNISYIVNFPTICRSKRT